MHTNTLKRVAVTPFFNSVFFGPEANWCFVAFGSQSRSKTINFKGVHTVSAQHKVDSAISLARDGLYSKACQIFTSSGVTLNSAETWHFFGK